MAKLDGLETVLNFLKGLQPKIAAQIAKKVLALNVEPMPPDCHKLKGYSDLYRVDSGEASHCLPFLASAGLGRSHSSRQA